MSRIWTTGLEHNSLDVFDSIGGAPTILLGGARTGSYCLRTPGTPAFDNCLVIIPSPRAELFVRVYVNTQTNTPNAAAVWLRLADDAGVILLEITETGQVWIGQAGVGLDAGNAGALTTSYQRYEIRLLVDNVAGILEVRVDGVTAISASGIDTRVGAVDNIEYFYIGDINGGTAHDVNLFDDIALNNTLGVVSNSWAGPGAVLGDEPDADGVHSDWTPSVGVDHYDVVDDANDATYISTDTPGDQDLFDWPDTVNPGHTGIVAFALWVRAERAAGAATVSHLYRQAGTDWVLPAFALGAAWDYYGYHTSENPIYNGMLTRGIFNAAEYGVKAIT